jgi:hypothetical protein
MSRYRLQVSRERGRWVDVEYPYHYLESAQAWLSARHRAGEIARVSGTRSADGHEGLRWIVGLSLADAGLSHTWEESDRLYWPGGVNNQVTTVLIYPLNEPRVEITLDSWAAAIDYVVRFVATGIPDDVHIVLLHRFTGYEFHAGSLGVSAGFSPVPPPQFETEQPALFQYQILRRRPDSTGSWSAVGWGDDFTALHDAVGTLHLHCAEWQYCVQSSGLPTIGNAHNIPPGTFDPLPLPAPVMSPFYNTSLGQSHSESDSEQLANFRRMHSQVTPRAPDDDVQQVRAGHGRVQLPPGVYDEIQEQSPTLETIRGIFQAGWNELPDTPPPQPPPSDTDPRDFAAAAAYHQFAVVYPEPEIDPHFYRYAHDAFDRATAYNAERDSESGRAVVRLTTNFQLMGLHTGYRQRISYSRQIPDDRRVGVIVSFPDRGNLLHYRNTLRRDPEIQNIEDHSDQGGADFVTWEARFVVTLTQGTRVQTWNYALYESARERFVYEELTLANQQYDLHIFDRLRDLTVWREFSAASSSSNTRNARRNQQRSERFSDPEIGNCFSYLLTFHALVSEQWLPFVAYYANAREALLARVRLMQVDANMVNQIRLVDRRRYQVFTGEQSETNTFSVSMSHQHVSFSTLYFGSFGEASQYREQQRLITPRDNVITGPTSPTSSSLPSPPVQGRYTIEYITTSSDFEVTAGGTFFQTDSYMEAVAERDRLMLNQSGTFYIVDRLFGGPVVDTRVTSGHRVYRVHYDETGEHRLLHLRGPSFRTQELPPGLLMVLTGGRAAGMLPGQATYQPDLEQPETQVVPQTPSEALEELDPYNRLTFGRRYLVLRDERVIIDCSNRLLRLIASHVQPRTNLRIVDRYDLSRDLGWFGPDAVAPGSVFQPRYVCQNLHYRETEDGDYRESWEDRRLFNTGDEERVDEFGRRESERSVSF